MRVLLASRNLIKRTHLHVCCCKTSLLSIKATSSPLAIQLQFKISTASCRRCPPRFFDLRMASLTVAGYCVIGPEFT